jgi:hypothetical protein
MPLRIPPGYDRWDGGLELIDAIPAIGRSESAHDGYDFRNPMLAR